MWVVEWHVLEHLLQEHLLQHALQEHLLQHALETLDHRDSVIIVLLSTALVHQSSCLGGLLPYSLDQCLMIT